jgi:gas vesicle protein
LTGIFDSNTRAIKAQKELLDTIDKTKVAEMTRYNVKVLQQLDISVAQFEKFNGYMTNVTLFVENSQHIVNRTNELLARTDNFKVIADNLDNKLNQSQQLLEFLSAHFKKLEEHKEFTSNAVADVGSAISETFKELKEHIQNSSEAMKNFTVDELELLKSALSESKTNLSNLEHLSTLKTDVSQFKNSSASQGERLRQAIEDLNKNMAKSIAILEGIEHSSLTYKAKGISTSIKNLFKSKK